MDLSPYLNEDVFLPIMIGADVPESFLVTTQQLAILKCLSEHVSNL